MIFDKYKLRGAYHWRQYNVLTSAYRRHVDRVIRWVRKGKTLDVGGGDGLITYKLKAEGIDIDSIAVRLAVKKGAKVKLGSAYKLKGLWDNILMLDVLEHLEFPEKALVQVHKSLNPGGYLYIVTPPKGLRPLSKYHYQEWTEQGLVDLVEPIGFKKIDIKTITENMRMYAIFELCQ